MKITLPPTRFLLWRVYFFEWLSSQVTVLWHFHEMTIVTLTLQQLQMGKNDNWIWNSSVIFLYHNLASHSHSPYFVTALLYSIFHIHLYTDTSLCLVYCIGKSVFGAWESAHYVGRAMASYKSMIHISLHLFPVTWQYKVKVTSVTCRWIRIRSRVEGEVEIVSMATDYHDNTVWLFPSFFLTFPKFFVLVSPLLVP